MSDEPMISITGIATRLGVAVSGVKKWRGRTIAVLREAGQLHADKPTVPLPRNALPLPDNQREHVRDGVAPRWWPKTIDQWVDRTERRDQRTGKFKGATPSGRPPGSGRREPVAA